jgi:hypothetical protein
MTQKKASKPKSVSRYAVRARQDAFLVAFGEVGSIRSAASAAGVGRSTVSDWISKDIQGFRMRMEAARHVFREYLQDMAFERVKNQKPDANPVLMITLLNRFWPEVFRRDAYRADDPAKEVMMDLRKWMKANSPESKKTEEEVEEASARKRAIDEVEKLLARKASGPDTGGDNSNQS